MENKYNRLSEEQLAMAQRQREEYWLTPPRGQAFSSLLWSKVGWRLQFLKHLGTTASEIRARSARRLRTAKACFTKTDSGWSKSRRNDWENPELLQIGREAARASLIPCATEAQAFSTERDASPFYRGLNGSWHFLYCPDGVCPDHFAEEDYDDTGMYPAAGR